MTCRGLCLGLHGLRRPSPWLAFAREDVAGLARSLEQQALRISSARLGPDDFHELELRDPSGLALRVLEARSFSPAAELPAPTLLGQFEALSLPLADFESGERFWQQLGANTVRAAAPWKQLRVDLEGFSLAFHRPALHDEPLMVFRQPDLAIAGEVLRSAGHEAAPGLGGFGAPEHLILSSPEGLALALLA
jgi:hypothetical protein